MSVDDVQVGRSSRLAFIRSFAQAALLQVALANESRWKLSKSTRAWATDNANMMRAMLRHVNKAINRISGLSETGECTGLRAHASRLHVGS